MALTLEWQRRVDHWRRELQTHFYRPLGTLKVGGFTTLEQLTFEEASGRTFYEMPTGTRWGSKWEYGWFNTHFTLPPEAAGKRIVLKMEVGGEGLVFINGIVAGAKDRQHTEITLPDNTPGTYYEVLVESYAGHGPMVAGGGPVGYGRQTVPEPPAQQQTVGESSFGIWNEEAYQLWFDVETLNHLRSVVDPESLRLAEIDQALMDFTLIADLELPPDEMQPTLTAARKRLAPLLACKNGTTMPTLYAVGHGHIDVAWLWPLQETERKMARTVSNQLALMAEYPEHKFIESQPHLYLMLKQRYPELYERYAAAMRAGKFIPEGAMWVEADTNLSGGESLIRQCIHGKRFFKEEFGIDSQILWLPDVFGYSGALPQILRGCGVKYFATQKIFWTYNGGDMFPYNTFTWEGIDGSEVLAHLFFDYNSETHPAALWKRWTDRPQKNGIDSLILAFGHGDGGGGPTRIHLEYLRRAADLEGAPRTKIVSPLVFFQDVEKKGVPRERYVGELYFQAHRGTYTSQARTKQNNRRAEFALREAELWSAAAARLAQRAYPLADFQQNWQTVLLLQFHDIIPGSSIHRVYEEAEAANRGVIARARQAAAEAAASLTQPAAQAITAFNSLSWSRPVLIELPAGFKGAVHASGRLLPTQAIDGKTFTEVTLPSCGWATVTLDPSTQPVEIVHAQKATPSLLENDLLRVTLNERGEITSIFDKEAGRELAAGVCNRFMLYKDVPNWFDAWDIDSNYEEMPVDLPEPAEIEVLGAGALAAAVRVRRRLHNSTVEQVIRLRHGSRRVDFITKVDWQERHKLLKVAFPVAYHANEALHEIQFGHIARPNHRSRPYDASRFEVCNHKWSALVEGERGFAVLNDSKYGLNVLGNSINLTLLKSPLAPDMTADLGEQTFTYAFYAWNGSMAQSRLLQEAYDLNTPVTTAPGSAADRSLFNLSAPNVVIETVKFAEDGSGDLIVRLYEAMRSATRCTLTTSLPVQSAWQTNMLEEEPTALPFAGGKVELNFRPFEIKTLRLR
ncbi:MAG TPA: glycoside hydrolase family 38 C-terminal domain-containing protein [Anaerolineaceae bacterium]